MSKEISIIYPFPQCQNCPIAQRVIEDVKYDHPYTGELQPKLEKIALACLVIKNEASTGGLRLDSYILPTNGVFKKAGETEYLNTSIRTWGGHPPEFCPQLKKSKRINLDKSNSSNIS